MARQAQEAANDGQQGDADGRDTVAAAEAALARGNPATALALLAGLPLPQHQQLPVRQLQALCHIKQAASSSGSSSSSARSPWWKVLGLDPAHASAADVRRQYRRLAALVHPDKCRLDAAAGAFQQLQAAVQRLLRSLSAAQPGGGQHGGARPSKRARTGSEAQHESDSSWQPDSEAECAEVEGEENEGWFRDGGGFPWWERWDTCQSGPEAAGDCKDCLGAETREREQSQQAAAAQQTEQQQQQQQQAEEEQARLLGMSLDELRSEVRQRQASLFDPQAVDSQGRRVPMAQLQAALKRARSLLAGRVAAEAAKRAAAADGGWLP